MIARILSKLGMVKPFELVLTENRPARAYKQNHERAGPQNDKHGQLKSLVVPSDGISHNLRKK